jgi:hypothetical protein
VHPNCAISTSVICSADDCDETQEYTATTHVWATKADESGNVVCTVCGETQADALKFQLSVTSDASVVATVYDDYSMIVTMPDGTHDTVNADKVTIGIKMQNVASLGGSGDYSKEITTSLEKTADLQDYLNNSYQFVDGTITLQLDDKYACTYEFKGSEWSSGDAKTITGKPVDADGNIDVESARTAWAKLMTEVTVANNDVNNTYMEIVNGSYLKIGQEKLYFDTNYKDESGNKKNLKLDNFSTLSKLEEEIRDALALNPNDQTYNGIIVNVAADTTLSIKSRYAQLKEDAYITIQGIDLNTTLSSNSDTTLATALSKLQSDNKNKYDLLLDMISAFDAVVGAVDNSSTGVTVDITFGE